MREQPCVVQPEAAQEARKVVMEGRVEAVHTSFNSSASETGNKLESDRTAELRDLDVTEPPDSGPLDLHIQTFRSSVFRLSRPCFGIIESSLMGGCAKTNCTDQICAVKPKSRTWAGLINQSLAKVPRSCLEPKWFLLQSYLRWPTVTTAHRSGGTPS